MQTFNNDGELVGEINGAITDSGEHIVTNTAYYGAKVVTQHITIRDDQGKIRTVNVIGGKLLP
ncbi:MAG TPA: hypothetical protein VEK33_19565 [Terriglobales bacterium]|nr:hypothetical protein [Terriglobales bacterium]